MDAVDDSLTDEKLSICDIIIIATYPGICIDFVKNNAISCLLLDMGLG